MIGPILVLSKRPCDGVLGGRFGMGLKLKGLPSAKNSDLRYPTLGTGHAPPTPPLIQQNYDLLEKLSHIKSKLKILNRF